MALLLPLHPFAPFRNQGTFLCPIAPTEIDTGVCGKRKVDWACNGEQRGNAMEDAHPGDKSPSPSLSLGSFLTGLYSAFQIQLWNALDMGWPT
jgi:hypothetical protein